MSPLPLISIGIPTYNRGPLLGRAIESALAQDYPNLQVLVCDNASTDDTAAVCQQYAMKDSRLRYVRHEKNLGAGENFRFAFENTRGELFAWLGDDDWMEATYISKCAAALLEKPDYSAVGAQVRFYGDDQFAVDEPPTNLVQDDIAPRVEMFFRRVGYNGIFYGVIRREYLEQALIRNILGFDWMVSAAIIACGKVGTIDQTMLHRATGGASKDYKSTAASLNVPLFFAAGQTANYATIAFHAFVQLAFTCPAFRKRLGLFSRMRLAGYAALVIIYRFIYVRVRIFFQLTR